MKIEKAVIPCGGLGTRFFPITKIVPKELLPIIDVPVISHIVNECVESGLNQILIIISPRKRMIKDYFFDDELYDSLMKMGKTEAAEQLRSAKSNADINFVVQKQPLGSAHAVNLAQKFTGNQPFCLALGDDITVSDVPVTKQLLDAFDSVGNTIVGVQRCDGDDIVKYGVADILSSNGKLHLLKGLAEKPSINNLPSRLACYGRYVLCDIYKYIAQISKGKNNEYQLTDALVLQCNEQKAYAYEFEGKRYDMGDKFGSLKAAIELSLERKDFGTELKRYLLNLASSLNSKS